MVKKKNTYFYKKKPKPISASEKMTLLALYAWGIDEIQKYWNVRQGIAYDIRNRIKNSVGTAPYSKSKVLVSEVMKQYNTTIEQQAKLLMPLLAEKKGATVINKDGNLYVKIDGSGEAIK